MKFLILLAAWLQVSHATPKEVIKQQAFVILNTKCNVCHAKENPSMVFTEVNMDQRARKIKLQVFTLKRMPKGNTIKLSDEERKTLKEWIVGVGR